MQAASVDSLNPTKQPSESQSPQNEDAMDQHLKRMRSPGLMEEVPPSKSSKGEGDAAPGKRQAVEVSNGKLQAARTRRELAEMVERVKPDGAKISEVLKTNDGRLLVFAETVRDYNLLLIQTRWSDELGIITTKIAVRTGGGKAVVVHDCDLDIDVEEILEALRKQGYAPSNGNRLKRAANGADTKSVKIWLDDESKIKKLVDSSFYFLYKKHAVTRYQPPRFQQCFHCQSLDHRSNNCTSEARKCMRCSGPHHHRECSATPAEYKCANCSENHSSNDSRCERIKEVVAKLTTSDNTTQSRQSLTTANASVQERPPVHQAWNMEQAPSRQSAAEDEMVTKAELKKIISEAVGGALRDEIGPVAKEIAKALGAEFRSTLSTVVSKFTESLDRYRNYAERLECQLAEGNVNEPNSENFPPGRGGTETISGGPSCGQKEMALEVPRILPEERSICITFPQPALVIQKGQRTSLIEKSIKQQLKVRVKIIEDEIRDMLPEIKRIYSPFAARSPAPRRRRQTSATGAFTSDSESESTAAGINQQKKPKKLSADRLNVFKVPSAAKPPPTATTQTKAPPPLPTKPATTKKAPTKPMTKIR